MGYFFYTFIHLEFLGAKNPTIRHKQSCNRPKAHQSVFHIDFTEENNNHVKYQKKIGGKNVSVSKTYR